MKEEQIEDEEDFIDVKEEIYRDVSPHQPEDQLRGECEKNLTLCFNRVQRSEEASEIN